MGLIYLVDTNIISEIMRPHPYHTVYRHWQEKSNQTAIAAVTWHELLTGTFRLPESRRRTAFSDFLHEQLMPRTPILPYDQEAAHWQAKERARLTKIGHTPAYADGQIAATAAANGLILVTRNVADFVNFAGLQVEDWFQPGRE